VELGQIRRRESVRALQSIGVPQDHVIFLGYPNMGLRWMWSARYWSTQSLWQSPFTKTDHSPFDSILTPRAPFCGAAVLHDLETVMSRVQPRQVFVTHPADIHPDHWATYCFTRLALEELRSRSGKNWPRRCQLLTYLVHRRGWPSPWGYYPRLHLMPPPALVDLPINEWFTRELSREQTYTKSRMILSYRSQGPVFDLLLRAFARRNELFAVIVAPATRRRQPDLSPEPRGETEYLRQHPGADIVRVEVTAADPGPSVVVYTAAPLARAELAVLCVAVAPAPGAVRASLVLYRPDRPVEASTASDDAGPETGVGDEVGASASGTSVRVSIPRSWTGPQHRFTVDVMTLAHGKIVDHAITRVVGAKPTTAP
jgi:LmbE family N-acetylglucosaminyl deacetylase